MPENNIIQFAYRTKNGVVEPKDCIVNLYSELIVIKGEETQIVFDPVMVMPVKMTGLYIEYKGISYGSISTTLVQLLAELDACGCPTDDEFRLFENLFDFEFE